ncbi:class I SAM-dependent methyltransferase [Methylobacterium sp. A54F]
MDRRETLLSLFDAAGLGLEIGPSYNPLVAKADGYRVETVDYIDRAGLLRKYANDPNVDVARIEEVDYVTEGRPLLEAVPHRGRFDYVVASHVIEHTPDLIDFLASCAELLRPEGVLVLAVPDKRFCFDLFQPLSTTGAILQANLDARRKPTPGAVFDSVAYDMLRGGRIGWAAESDEAPVFNATLDAARRVFEICAASPNYVDVHVWRFVPSSFRLIVDDLFNLGRSPLREAAFRPGTGHEFYVALARNGAGPGTARAELAIAAMRELAAVPLPPRG